MATKEIVVKIVIPKKKPPKNVSEIIGGLYQGKYCK